jgi:hypothetical protein
MTSRRAPSTEASRAEPAASLGSSLPARSATRAKAYRQLPNKTGLSCIKTMPRAECSPAGSACFPLHNVRPFRVHTLCMAARVVRPAPPPRLTRMVTLGVVGDACTCARARALVLLLALVAGLDCQTRVLLSRAGHERGMQPTHARAHAPTRSGPLPALSVDSPQGCPLDGPDRLPRRGRHPRGNETDVEFLCGWLGSWNGGGVVVRESRCGAAMLAAHPRGGVFIVAAHATGI